MNIFRYILLQQKFFCYGFSVHNFLFSFSLFFCNETYRLSPHTKCRYIFLEAIQKKLKKKLIKWIFLIYACYFLLFWNFYFLSFWMYLLWYLDIQSINYTLWDKNEIYVKVNKWIKKDKINKNLKNLYFFFFFNLAWKIR